ncbi:calmodulin [Eurytemora carolleeae]|uniref:calmodulin n=1 Tax=Eurytemora carolleeae TaxID=1294199 RepID=UPI000C781741|nr:calmodulin [Eurytemora carolleeae]|eukprot:XP_023320776.1 calmodulin-like [Eurytemora affinis]
MKLQNGIECGKDEVRGVCGPLPCTKDGKIKIRDFLYLDVTSEAAFRAMDRNKDGFITKGELKLAKKKMSMKEVDQVIQDYDLDQDGKLSYEEYLAGTN